MADLATLRHDVLRQDTDRLLGSEAFDLIHRLRLATLEILDLAETQPERFDRILTILAEAWRDNEPRPTASGKPPPSF